MPLPFEKNRLDHRAYRERIGKPYYGGDLRRLLNREPEPEDPTSLVEKIDIWLSAITEDRPFMASCIIAIAMVAGVSLIVALLI